MDLPVNPTVAPSPTQQTYTVPGLTGKDDVSYTFHWKQLKGSSSSDSALTNYADDLRYYSNKYFNGTSWQTRSSGTYLFTSGGFEYITAGNTLFNPVLLTQIDLPNGLSYKFSYNVYGEIEKIVYPTGGEETFTYDTVAANSFLDDPYAGANRGVVDRKLYKSPSDSSPYEWTYSSTVGSTTAVNPDGTRYERYMHISPEGAEYGFDSVIAGMPYEERTYTSDGHLVLRKLTHWIKNDSGSDGAQWHPRVDYDETIAYNTSGNGVSAVTKHEYYGDLSYKDTPVLENKTTTYAFMTKTDGGSFTAGTGPSSIPAIPTATPSTTVRMSELTYLIEDSNYSAVKSDYTDQNINGLVTVAKIKDGSGTVVSQSETVYDESGRSPGYRGNPTTAKAWDSTKGASTSSGSYIATHAKFDSYGNQYEATDALGNTTTTTFDSTYHAFPVTVTSPVPDSTNTHGSNSAFTTSATFDISTGLPLTATDANGLTTAIEYDEATLRPRYTRFYDGSTQVGPTNETIYHDEAGNSWVKAKNQIDDTHYAENTAYVDGLGRAFKTEELNSAGNIFTEKEFDAEGRVYRVSNPYRSGDTKVWTTNTYDTASRVVSVTLPDSSTVTTDYGISTSSPVGVTKTITDQAGRKRKGYTDVSGNMVRVIEDPASSALATDYTFDTLGNLRKTAQGSQYRYFYHDSLGRLLYAKQVEQDANSNFSGSAFADPITGNNQWSVKYEYNDGGSIVSTTDANNVSVSASYDALNRIYNRDYSDSTPDVSFYYDGRGLGSVPAYSNGKTTKVTSSASETRNMSFDIFGHLLTHRQTTDGNGYDTAYSYNIAGALIEETYPSGRVVKNTLSENGDLSQIQSKKNSTAGYWAYAKGFAYDRNGALTKMQFGNGLWETYSYNSRQQVTQIGLGVTDADKGLLKLEYAYNTTGNTDDNGAMLEQKITVPTIGATSGFTATQTYAYDALNRISSATETVSSTQTWKQEFSYDRYGNRSFVTGSGHTTTLGSCSTDVCNPTMSSSTNRMTSTGYSYDANGSLTANAAGERFGYDGEGHQTAFFTASNGGSTPDATYVYDGEGKRIKKVSATETTIFVYDAGGKVVAEYSTTLATVQQVSYLTQDHLGSPRVTTNKNGEVTNRKDFAAFGDEVVSAQRVSGNKYASTPDEVRKDYTGYEKDEESGLEYAQARYYNTTHGRFTSVDPLTASATIRNPQTLNRYSYALNSPYKFVDPLGLLSQYSTGACGSNCSNSESRWTQSSGGPMTGGGVDSSFDLLLASIGPRSPQSEPPSADPVLAAAAAEGLLCDPNFDYEAFAATLEPSAQSVMSPSETWAATAFGSQGAYFANPNDGNTFDATKQINRDFSTKIDPENHIYPSASDPKAKGSFYVPEGGTYIGTSEYTEESGTKIKVYMVYFAKLGGIRNVTIGVFHLVNFDPHLSRDATGRRKLGDFGPGNGGEWEYMHKTVNGKIVSSGMGSHIHLEIFRGRWSHLPPLGHKPFTTFNGVVGQ